MPSVLDNASAAGVNPDDGHALGFGPYAYLLQPLLDESPRIVIQKGAQVGATVMAILRAIHFLDVHQCHTMYLFPTHRSALRFSRGRFQVLLDRSPRWRHLVQRVRSAAHLRLGDANFYCHGARSRTELLSTPVQYLTLDERDALHLGPVGSKQPWSAVELARQRLSGQARHWELDLSTPTIPGHGVAAEFAGSDQHHFHLACPHCATWTRPTWPEAIASPALTSPNSVPVDARKDRLRARFRCPACRRVWSRAERRFALSQGKWLAHAPGQPWRGYHLSQLVAPHASAERLVRQWLDAQGHASALQVFHNGVLGEPYLPDGARLERRFVDEAKVRGGQPMSTASQGSVAGIDVGPKVLHVVVAEPGPGQELRIVWVGKVPDFVELRATLRRLRVRSWVIDALPETHHVRSLLRDLPGGWMCFYKEAGTAMERRDADRSLHVPRTDALDDAYQRWRLGRIRAPSDLPTEFVEQLEAPVRVLQPRASGGYVATYLDGGAADHFAHAMNYCTLAAAFARPWPSFAVRPPAADGSFSW